MECEVCHRSEPEYKIVHVKKAGMYLCAKHRHQIERHGKILPDEKPVHACDVCGVTNQTAKVCFCQKAGKYLCTKHKGQFDRLGYFKTKTKRDRNDYIIHDDYAEIIFYDTNFNVSGSAFIDVEDVERCRPHKWMITEMMGNSQYVKSVINHKHVSLHRFVMQYDGNQVIDHINRNGLDNRKANLRIVTPSENSSNSKTRSQTGEKNIYRKNNRFQVQIIRNYMNVYTETFDTLQEAIVARDRFLRQYNKDHNRVV